MSKLKHPYGLYREQMPGSDIAYAYVSDGALTFDVDEAAYRLRGYVPVFDSLPTKAEYLQNEDKLA